MRTLSALAPEPLREAPQQVKGARLTHNVIKKKKAEERAEMSGPLHLLFAGTTRRGRPHHHIVPVPHNVERVFVGMASYVAEWWQSVRSINFRQLCLQVISLGMFFVPPSHNSRFEGPDMYAANNAEAELNWLPKIPGICALQP